MDKRYLVDQLQRFATLNSIILDEETLGKVVSNSTFRVVSKGERLAFVNYTPSVYPFS